MKPIACVADQVSRRLCNLDVRMHSIEQDAR